MNIAMTGATGYIGKHLSSYLTEKGGHRIIPLGRAMFREGMSGLLVQTLTHCDVIINLAGAPINQRWTPEHKQELFNSRITVTHRIIRALNAVKTKPKLMISASAVGYYPSLVESDEYTQTRGDGFLSDLCYAWEKEAKRCPQPTRLVITRFGVVLSPDGGAMQQMLRPLRATKDAAYWHKVLCLPVNPGSFRRSMSVRTASPGNSGALPGSLSPDALLQPALLPPGRSHE